MTKAEFAAAVAEKTGSTKVEAEKSVNAFLDIVKETLMKGEKITFTGFGSFEVSQRSARTGRNPQTGAELKIAASRLPKFSAGKTLKEAVNSK